MPKRMKLVFKLFAVVVVGSMFLVMPSAGPGSGAAGFFGVQDACAQTGTCSWSPPDICFVNGNAYYDREWVSGGTKIE